MGFLDSHGLARFKAKMETLIAGKLAKNQGASNAGLFMKVNTDGELIPSAVPDPTGLVFYGTCSTAAATQRKDVTIAAVTSLTAGDVFVITFTNNQNYNGVPTMQINSLGAKNIRRLTGSNAERYEWSSGETIYFVWNGTYFLIINGGFATTTYYGRTKLATGATSTSESVALTPKSLNSFAQSLVSGASVYSARSTYAVGDRVRYGYLQYECKVAITTAEAWNAAHWTALDPLQTQITGKADKVTNATSGNFAGLDGNGNLTDSGSKASDFLQRSQGVANAGKVVKVNDSGYLELTAFDSTPTASSNNPVTSGGVKTALDAIRSWVINQSISTSTMTQISGGYKKEITDGRITANTEVRIPGLDAVTMPFSALSWETTEGKLTITVTGSLNGTTNLAFVLQNPI